MSSIDRYIQTIQQAYPGLSIRSAQLNDEGQNNNVLVVNESLIFRFPKYAAGIEQLQDETALLHGIRDYITLAIPDPAFVCLGGRAVGEAFVGYQRIPGEPLWHETLHQIHDSAALDSIAAQLGQFLRELHHVPVALAIQQPVALFDTRAEWEATYGRIRAKLFPHMRADAQAWTARHFERFLGDRGNFGYIPVLKHGDFGTSNILFDRETCRIRGIIDFGGSGLGDPAYDVAGLLGYGEPFVRRLAAVYPEIESFWERSVFYKGTFALIEALFGAENGDREAFESGIADYR